MTKFFMPFFLFTGMVTVCNEPTVTVRNLHFSRRITITVDNNSWIIDPLHERVVPSRPFNAAISGNKKGISVNPESAATLITIAPTRLATYILQSKNYIPLPPSDQQ